MKYNCSIQNDDVIPIPYSIVDGKNISVGSLFKDKPMFIWVDYITGGSDGRSIRLVGQVNRPIFVVVPIDSNLLIKFVNETQRTDS